MGLLYRALALLALGVLLSKLLHQATGDAMWQRASKALLKWLVVVILVVLGTLVLRRGAMFI